MKERILSLLIGYVLGSILTAEIIVRRKTGRPASEFGSGNPGMANIMRVFGFRAGIAVLAGDLLKTAAAALLSCFLFPEQGQILVLYAGLGAVTGHNWPLWNRLKGGKGAMRYADGSRRRGRFGGDAPEAPSPAEPAVSFDAPSCLPVPVKAGTAQSAFFALWSTASSGTPAP